MDRPLVITEDHDLLDDLLRVAAAAGAELDVTHVPAHARPYWNRAPLVVVGGDVADALAAVGPPPRPRVFLATRTPEDPDMWRKCVAVGAQAVLELPSAERRLVDEFADAVEPPTRPGAVVCVAAGRGGAGASVLAVSLALTASRRRLRTLLIDADPLGGGLDVLLGQEECDGARWSDLVAREGRVSFTALQAALPTFAGLTVLSFHRGEVEPVPAEAMRSVLEAGQRGFDLVVVDLPRYLDQAAVEVLGRATSTLLVVTADVRGVLAAAQVLAGLRKHTGEVRAIVRDGVLDHEVVTGSLGVPYAGSIPDQPRLTAMLNRGDVPPTGRRTSLGRFCGSFLDAVLGPDA
ncbi:secretion/DNA translocation related CpaE-like protein [Streptosporangium becharense]|uniref:Secretion/DNA translocation related CpaE-like protein n=1 Tax=Streptosporangium becharense TaxID=1816182 RepID=A0A7W9MH25_9ACTN|nr:septum site-determining protein Ssd [Streptosporangium becharense]MBB2908963.1 secretion/DNA translocation related CpaE-like protein [Streptosporangium becharense]MBB5820019.1 secretion/DNA translocation related CpaE-like protein [Streptosporangium becharense]